MKEVRAGDSGEQRSAEPVMLAALGARLRTTFKPHTYAAAGGARLTIDGVSEEPLILCEAYAHQGPLKSAQKDKVVADAFRLVFAERLLGRPARKIILLADEVVAKQLKGQGWVAAALRAFGVEVFVVALPRDLRQRIREAQKRQYR